MTRPAVASASPQIARLGRDGNESGSAAHPCRRLVEEDFHRRMISGQAPSTVKQTSTRDRRRYLTTSPPLSRPHGSSRWRVMTSGRSSRQIEWAQLLSSDGLPNGAALLLGVYFRHGLYRSTVRRSSGDDLQTWTGVLVYKYRSALTTLIAVPTARDICPSLQVGGRTSAPPPESIFTYFPPVLVWRLPETAGTPATLSRGGPPPAFRTNIGEKMTWESRIASVFRLDEAGWARHANP